MMGFMDNEWTDKIFNKISGIFAVSIAYLNKVICLFIIAVRNTDE